MFVPPYIHHIHHIVHHIYEAYLKVDIICDSITFSIKIDIIYESIIWGVSINVGTPIDAWSTREKPIEMDDD